jgi:hypothetical protein
MKSSLGYLVGPLWRWATPRAVSMRRDTERRINVCVSIVKSIAPAAAASITVRNSRRAAVGMEEEEEGGGELYLIALVISALSERGAQGRSVTPEF